MMLIDKETLRHNRVIRMQGKLKDLSPFWYAWTAAERAQADAAWVEIDSIYENDKAELREKLEKLKPDELKKYFTDYGIDEKPIIEYLPVSPAK